MKFLGLGDNKINSLSTSTFSGLTNLENLSLSNNSLKSLPESIFQETANLHRLLLSRNKIAMLPELLFQDNSLPVLYLDNNEITALPESFKELADIEYLDLSYNQLSDITVLANNVELGAEDRVFLRFNCLDISGPPDLIDIQTLQNRGVNVRYDIQKTDCQ